MKDKLSALMAEKKKGELSPEEVQAKQEVLMELLEWAQDAMGGRVKSGMDELMAPAKVEVMADSPEGLEEGLDKAKDVIEEMPEDMMEGDESEEDSDEDEDDEDSEDEEDDRKKSFLKNLL